MVSGRSGIITYIYLFCGSAIKFKATLVNIIPLWQISAHVHLFAMQFNILITSFLISWLQVISHVSKDMNIIMQIHRQSFGDYDDNDP